MGRADTAHGAHAAGLFPVEAAAIARARPARIAEFAAGRAAARLAMAELGLSPCAVAMRPDRAPDWPAGVVGSIAHDGALCLAALSRAGDLRAIGIDTEPALDLPADLIEEIATPHERAWLDGRDAGSRGRMARAIFVAKEATYKALYPLSPQVVGFDAMQVIPDAQLRGFAATLAIRFGPFAAGSVLNGRLGRAEGRIIAALALPGAGH